jgi:hypothetical protein
MFDQSPLLPYYLDFTQNGKLEQSTSRNIGVNILSLTKGALKYSASSSIAMSDSKHDTIMKPLLVA